MEIRVIERWVDDPERSRQAAEFVRSLAKHAAVRRVLGNGHAAPHKQENKE